MTAVVSRRPAARGVAVPLAALAAVALGVVTLARARHDPGGSFGGASTVGTVAELGGGWSLVGAALLFSRRHRRSRGGILFAVAGLLWFLREWSNPAIGTSLGFAAGLVLFVACVPVVAHAALAHPVGRLRSRAERLVVLVAYVEFIGVLGVLPAAVFDPGATGCVECPTNPLLVYPDARLFGLFNRWGIRIGLAWLVVLVAAFAWRMLATRRSTRTTVPVLAATAAYLVAVGWELEHGLAHGVLGNDASAQRAWQLEALALVLVSGSVLWGLIGESRARAAAARLVVELARAPTAGGLRGALRVTLGDASLSIAYRRTDSDEYIDADGRRVEVEPGPSQAVTDVRLGATTVAALLHDARLLDEPGLLTEAVSATQLALVNEQLQAEVQAQLDDLKRSRSRIVEAANSARRQLERDLHDGAQQRLVSLSLALELLRVQLGPGADAAFARALEDVRARLDAALDSLREIAHGLYPAVLADHGLSAALEMLSERSVPAVDLVDRTAERLPPAVENVAYFTVAEALQGASWATVSLIHEGDDVAIEIDRHGSPTLPLDRLLEVADRVGAIGGRIAVNRDVLRVEIPCAS